MRLDQLPLRQAAHITAINWDMLDPAEGRRLRELGFDEGAAIAVHNFGGIFKRGPLACRIGRMTVALRRNHAAAVTVALDVQS